MTVLLLVGVFATAFVLAEENQGQVSPRVNPSIELEDDYGVYVKGTGYVKAWGDGYAELKGSTTTVLNGVVEVSGENGFLRVSENAQIEVTGNGKRYLENGWWVYEGDYGKATITGEHIGVKVKGDSIVLYAKGTGSVFLDGKGKYETGGITRSYEGKTTIALEHESAKGSGGGSGGGPGGKKAYEISEEVVSVEVEDLPIEESESESVKETLEEFDKEPYKKIGFSEIWRGHGWIIETNDGDNEGHLIRGFWINQAFSNNGKAFSEKEINENITLKIGEKKTIPGTDKEIYLEDIDDSGAVVFYVESEMGKLYPEESKTFEEIKVGVDESSYEEGWARFEILVTTDSTKTTDSTNPIKIEKSFGKLWIDNSPYNLVKIAEEEEYEVFYLYRGNFRADGDPAENSVGKLTLWPEQELFTFTTWTGKLKMIQEEELFGEWDVSLATDYDTLRKPARSQEVGDERPVWKKVLGITDSAEEESEDEEEIEDSVAVSETSENSEGNVKVPFWKKIFGIKN